jgi:transposase-like protein
MTRNSKLKVPEIMNEPGRPSKFTPERRSAIVDAISHRIPYEYAAEANGISERTLHDWLNTARVHQTEGIDSEYTEFSQAIKRAEMTRMREHSDMIAAKPERWQADAWLLERRWPKHYGPNAQLNELNQRLSKLEHGEPTNEDSSNEENSKEG